MKLHIDILHQGGGQFFLASGRTKPDKYRFVRVQGESHIHRLEIADKDIDATLDDLALRLQQSDIPVRIRVIVEDNDRDGSERIAELEEALASAGAENDRLREAAKQPPVLPPAAPEPVKIDEERLGMLRERDELLTVLADFRANDDETPLQVLIRLTEPLRETAPDAAPTPAVGDTVADAAPTPAPAATKPKPARRRR